MLALEGKLSLDDEAQRYLPEIPRLGRGPAYRVTIRQMLQHTSGWPDYVDLLVAAGTPFEAAATAGDAMAVLTRQHVGNFAPGTEWMYSNTGYFLAAQIVERVTATSMREFLRTRVFAPLGMTHTDVFDDHTRLFPDTQRIHLAAGRRLARGANELGADRRRRDSDECRRPGTMGRELRHPDGGKQGSLRFATTACAPGGWPSASLCLRARCRSLPRRASRTPRRRLPGVSVGGHALSRATDVYPDDV